MIHASFKDNFLLTRKERDSFLGLLMFYDPFFHLRGFWMTKRFPNFHYVYFSIFRRTIENEHFWKSVFFIIPDHWKSDFFGSAHFRCWHGKYNLRKCLPFSFTRAISFLNFSKLYRNGKHFPIFFCFTRNGCPHTYRKPLPYIGIP